MSKAASPTIQASDPASSAWVSANAGSGKTYVLTTRVIRLLLDGTPPARILCLTYTRAAAAEMRQRVFDVLGEWAVKPEAEVTADIAAREGRAPNAERLARARRLFATALETPGGLKIQTIHAFCERLVARFPLEADAPVPFSVISETDAAALKADSRVEALERLGAEGEADLMDALAPFVSGSAFAALFEGQSAQLMQKYRDADPWAVAGLRTGTTPDDVAEAAGYDDPGRIDFLRRTIEALTKGSKNDKPVVEGIRRGLEAEDLLDRFDAIATAFMTQDRKKVRESFGLKGQRDLQPELYEAIEIEAARAFDLYQMRCSAESALMTRALAALGDGVRAIYAEKKRARGLLDFDDLITAAEHLLRNSEAAAWALYKLDGGLDHILIDEAQDTSPAQWRVVERLAEEFFAGLGASSERSDKPRTLFAVGDVKQSIFSFQGADPAEFDRFKTLFAARAKGAKAAFLSTTLNESRRSVPAILALADAVFEPDETLRQAVSASGWTPHVAHRAADQGAVEIWPLAQPEEAPVEDDWEKPVDAIQKSDPVNVLARELAKAIKGWIGVEAVHDRDSREGLRPMQAGDVLILVRARGHLSQAIIRSLKKENVPVAGADRLALLEHIAVRDLIAYGRAILLPQDDLNLAALLRSPFFDLSEDELYRLAHDRGAASLWARLNEAAEPGTAILESPERARLARDALRAAMDRLGRDAPFDFYARLLAEGGRAAILRRMGVEAEDVIDEFLSAAAGHEEDEAPSLEGFLHALEATEAQVKRDPDAAGGAVRVLTAHGAKGLEAPVVILPDTIALPPPTYMPKLLAHGGALVWRPAGSPEGRAASEAWRAAEYEEYNRLLYVALTRPRDRLIVCGIQPFRMPKQQLNWYKAIEAGFDRLACTSIDTPFGPGRRHGTPAPAFDAAHSEGGAADSPALPAWVTMQAVQEAPIAQVRPSSVAPKLAFDDAASSYGLERGRVIHRLLESLPDLAAEKREAAAQRFLSARAANWTEAQRAETVAHIVALLADPAFAAAFAPGSKAEAPIAGRVAALGPDAFISGQIDRLAVTDSEVLVVDYKTNRKVPESAERAPGEYLKQMALYREAMRAAFPGRTVRTALLWTEAPSLMALEDGLLDAALQQLRAA